MKGSASLGASFDKRCRCYWWEWKLTPGAGVWIPSHDWKDMSKECWQHLYRWGPFKRILAGALSCVPRGTHMQFGCSQEECVCCNVTHSVPGTDCAAGSSLFPVDELGSWTGLYSYTLQHSEQSPWNFPYLDWGRGESTTPTCHFKEIHSRLCQFQSFYPLEMGDIVDACFAFPV